MLKAAKKQKIAYLNNGYLDIESIEKFPCTDLGTIDQLWVKYSYGRFGFSVQKRIWESVGGKPGKEDYEIFKTWVGSFGGDPTFVDWAVPLFRYTPSGGDFSWLFLEKSLLSRRVLYTVTS
jgi:hypothetical protein